MLCVDGKLIALLDYRAELHSVENSTVERNLYLENCANKPTHHFAPREILLLLGKYYSAYPTHAHTHEHMMVTITECPGTVINLSKFYIIH